MYTDEELGQKMTVAAMQMADMKVVGATIVAGMDTAPVLELPAVRCAFR